MAEASPGLTLFRQAHDQLLRQYLELERQDLSSDVIDKQLMESADTIIRNHNTAAVVAGKLGLSAEDSKDFRAHVRGMMGGGPLVPLLERDDVENIHILGHENVILSLADGRRIAGPSLAGSEEELVMMIRHLAATAGHTSRRFDTAAPILDLRLASGHRLFAVTAVAERTSVVIRRHRMLQSSLENLEQTGTVTPEMTAVLRAAVRPPNPANMLVVGGTGAGKTTLLRSLLSEVPQSELIVTIEDTLELHLRSSGLHTRTLALETRTSNTEGTGEISMYDLCKAALRMSPDRVIVGEVRGGEVMQLLQSMGIGNDGSLGTIHAGSTRAAINKMLIYAQRSPDSPTPDSVLREIAEVLHLLVYIKKLPDGRRAVTSIREVVGFDDEVVTSEVFAPGPDGVGVYVRPFTPGGEPLARLVAAGFDPSVLGEPHEGSNAASQPAPAEPAPSDQPPQPSRPPRQRPQPAPRQPRQPQPAYRPDPQPAHQQPRQPQPNANTHQRQPQSLRPPQQQPRPQSPYGSQQQPQPQSLYGPQQQPQPAADVHQQQPQSPYGSQQQPQSLDAPQQQTRPQSPYGPQQQPQSLDAPQQQPQPAADVHQLQPQSPYGSQQQPQPQSLYGSQQQPQPAADAHQQQPQSPYGPLQQPGPLGPGAPGTVPHLTQPPVPDPLEQPVGPRAAARARTSAPIQARSAHARHGG